jgi:hypothetical protein
MDPASGAKPDSEDGFLKGKRYLLMDRDTKYSEEFRTDGNGIQRGASPTSAEIAQFERSYRKIYAFIKRRMLGAPDSFWRRIIAKCRNSISCSLSRGETPLRAAEPADSAWR